MLLHHFSEDDSIKVFEPHVPKTNPDQAPAVWAIDTVHAPLYWFPRQCPRITVWPRDASAPSVYRSTFCTAAWRLHAIEFAWFETMASTALYRYDLDAESFEPWAEATGQWISREAVRPLECSPVGDLLEQHRSAGIELRLVDDLWPLAALVADEQFGHEWNFSMVRMGNAAEPRSSPPPSS